MLSFEDKKLFIKEIKKIEKVEEVFEMKNYIQHGNTSTFDHCLLVSYFCFFKR